MNQQFMKWVLELCSQEYGGRLAELLANMKLVGVLE